MKRFDAIIIGSGQGGTPLAKKLADAGYNTALIERRWVGGTCVNDGCTPTKAMISSAKLAQMITQSAALGIAISKSEVAIEAIVERTQKIVESFRNGSEKQLLSTKNLTLIYGDASFISQKELSIKMNDGTIQEATAELIFIDTGTNPNVPDVDGLNHIPYLTSTSILNLKELPEHLLIVGSGYVGLEFGQMYSRFGSKVTILERSERILKKEDEDIASEVSQIFREENIEIKLNTRPIKFTNIKNGIEVVIIHNGKEKTVFCSHVLLAAGRKPNSDGLHLHLAGIGTNVNGYITVDSHLETNVKGTYAIGEVNGEPAFTHISYNDYLITYNNLVRHQNQTTEHRLIPYCMYIDPQLARVGITEQEANSKKLNVKIAKLPMAKVARAIETGETRGLMKAVVDADSKKILGVAILGAEGGEIMSVLQMAMMGEVTFDKIRDGIFAHPTYAEALNNLFATVTD